MRGMGALGYATGTLEPLITLRDHGVTPDYAKALASFGYAKLPVEQLQRARDHGVTADYVQGMKDAGFGGLPLDEMINDARSRRHAGVRQGDEGAGDHRFAAELVTARDHGITLGLRAPTRRARLQEPAPRPAAAAARPRRDGRTTSARCRRSGTSPCRPTIS